MNLKQFHLLICFVLVTGIARSQTPKMYYYNPKGITFIPSLKKPSVIYQGKMFTGRKQLSALFSYLNNEELNKYFKKYKSNRTASSVLRIAGIGLSAYSLIDWRSSSRKFNWYTFGGGLVISGVSGYLDAKASANLLATALIFDKVTQKTTFIPQQSTVTLTISLGK